MGKVYTGFQTKTAQKPQAHSFMSDIREYAPPPLPQGKYSACTGYMGQLMNEAE